MKNYSSGLYVVSTPISINFSMPIERKKSDIIFCEDTRRSLKLLNHLKIKKKFISNHKFNEKKQVDKVIEYLNEGKILSLISDAGTPVLKDLQLYGALKNVFIKFLNRSFHLYLNDCC